MVLHSVKRKEMEYEKFRIRRAQIAQQIYEALSKNPPKNSIAIHRPDDIGATGIDYGEEGYLLIQVEDAT